MKHFTPFAAAALFLLTLALSACNSDKVYICTGPQSHAYHTKRNCKGLKNCSRSVKTVTLEEAGQMHRHPCRFCCK